MILCAGAFDGFHAGHLAYLQAAADLDPGAPLVVAIAPDSYIRRAKNRSPRWTQEERAAVVAGQRVVTRVITQADDSVANTIREAKPLFFVKGIDWVDKLPEDVVTACVHANTSIVFVIREGTHASNVHW